MPSQENISALSAYNFVVLCQKTILIGPMGGFKNLSHILDISQNGIRTSSDIFPREALL